MAASVDIISEPVNVDDAADQTKMHQAAAADVPADSSDMAGLQLASGETPSVNGEEIDAATKKSLWKAVHTCNQCLCWDTFCGFMLGLHLPYVINEMMNGDPDTATSESQRWFSVCMAIRSATLVFMSELMTVGGSWWGRKKILLLCQLAYLCAVVSFISAVLADAIALLLIGNVFFGCVSGDKASVMAYVADVSTLESHKKNSAWIAAWAMWGLFLSMLCYLALSPLSGFAVGGVLVFISLWIREIWLPDRSPPMEKRKVPSWKDILSVALPTNVYNSYKLQTPYVKCLLWTQFAQFGSGGALHGYFVNYVLVRYGIEQAEAGLLVATAGILSGITMTFGQYCLPIRATTWLMWTTPLYALYITVMSARHTMWTAFFFYCPRLIPLAQMNVIFYGQLSARRRHELSSLDNMSERCGYLTGAIAVTIYSPMWIDNYQKGDQSYPAVPIISLFFDILIVLIYYLGTFQYQKHDMYGKHFMVVTDGNEADKDSASPKAVKVGVKGVDEGH